MQTHTLCTSRRVSHRDTTHSPPDPFLSASGTPVGTWTGRCWLEGRAARYQHLTHTHTNTGFSLRCCSHRSCLLHIWWKHPLHICWDAHSGRGRRWKTLPALIMLKEKRRPLRVKIRFETHTQKYQIHFVVLTTKGTRNLNFRPPKKTVEKKNDWQLLDHRGQWKIRRTEDLKERVRAQTYCRPQTHQSVWKQAQTRDSCQSASTDDDDCGCS